MSTTKQKIPNGWERQSQHMVFYPGYVSTDPTTQGKINIIVYGLYEDFTNFRQIIPYDVDGVKLGVKIVDSNAKKCKEGEELQELEKILEGKKERHISSYKFGRRAWTHDILSIRYD